MAHSVENRPANPANALRAQLDSLERLSVAPDATNIETLLLTLDDVQENLSQLATYGMDLRSEQNRFENVTRRLDSRPALITSAASGVGGLAALRRIHPDVVNPWWFADVEQARRRRRTLIIALSTAAGIALFVFLAWSLITFLVPPDAGAIAMIDANTQIERAMIEGDANKALDLAQTAWDQMPNEPELALWVSLLAHKVGDDPRSADALDRARALLGKDSLGLQLRLAELNLRLSDPQAADAAANKALQIDAASPEATLLKARAAAEMGDRQTALEYLEKTWTLAGDDKPHLAVNARIIWGQIVQQPDFSSPLAPGE
jgi:hypothetical protein